MTSSTRIDGQILGSKLIEEGYELDSIGLAIDPGSYYCFEGYPAHTALWRASLPGKPKNIKPIARK